MEIVCWSEKQKKDLIKALVCLKFVFDVGLYKQKTIQTAYYIFISVY